MKVKKFTDEQLSRILGHAHELTKGGCQYSAGCINQVAYNEHSLFTAAYCNLEVAKAFDASTENLNTPISILRFLEALGAA